MAARFGDRVFAAEVVKHVTPSAIARFRIFDESLQLELIALVTLFIRPRESRHIVVVQVGLDQVIMP